MDPGEVNLWKNSFFKENFSVDQCLAEYTQKSDLESLRRDLKNYGSELQAQMSEILKNETEAIVNLAEYLTSLNSKINNLSVPISQLREEIRTLYDLIKTAEHSFKVMLGDVKNNNSQQNHVHLKLGIVTSSVYINSVIKTIDDDPIGNMLTLERVVNRYSFQRIYLDELNLITPDVEWVVKKVELKLIENVNFCFLKSFEDGNIDILTRSLRMFVNLQKQDEAYKTFQTVIIRPILQSLFTERYLEKSGNNLEKIYTEIKYVLESHVMVLQKIISENADLCSFNFVVNSFWIEFNNQSREGLPHITAPGNPELFQKRFISTYNILQYIAEKAGDKNLVRDNDSFQDNLKRFNLPVYFEIKFQQIAGNFETDTFSITFANIVADNNEHNFKLKLSIFLWKALVACFNKDVYIDQCADQFVRLSMMLLARYINILEKLLGEVVSLDISKEKVDEIIMDALVDLEKIETLVAPKLSNSDDLQRTVFRLLNKNVWPIIAKVFRANEKTLGQMQNKLKEDLISSKVTGCVGYLQNVTAIPRLYRRTNRNPPKQASSYMVQAIKPIVEFEHKFQNKIKLQLNEIVNGIVVSITKKYLALVQEVLMSVCKTEESLRRLKIRTQNASGDDASQGSSDTMSDETKIREQIKYDVGYFYDKLYPLGLNSGKEALDLLRKEVCA